MSLEADLIRYCRRLYQRELVSSTGGNVTHRGVDGSILITPTGRALADLEEVDLVRVTLDGKVLSSGSPSKELPFHLAIYRERPDTCAVIHGHNAYAVAASTMLEPDPVNALPVYSAGYAIRVGTLPLLPYLPSGSAELSEAMTQALAANGKAVLLQNHGFVTVGRDLEAAFNTAEELLDALKVYVLSAGKARPLPEEAWRAVLAKGSGAAGTASRPA